MDLTTVISNLDNTITGKESLMAEYKNFQQVASTPEYMALHTSVEFLKINIAELQRIRDDLKLINPPKKHKFGVRELEDDYIEFYLDGELLERVNYEDHGYTGMQAMDEMFRLLAEKLDIVVEELEIQEED